MAQSKQKRPEPAVSAQGEQNCPWFHLNSCLADTHFVPGNGGGRRAISCPRSRGAFPSRLWRIFTSHPLSEAPPLGTILCPCFEAYCMTVFPRCQGNLRFFRPVSPVFFHPLQMGLQEQIDIAGQRAVLSFSQTLCLLQYRVIQCNTDFCFKRLHTYHHIRLYYQIVFNIDESYRIAYNRTKRGDAYVFQ